MERYTSSAVSDVVSITNFSRGCRESTSPRTSIPPMSGMRTSRRVTSGWTLSMNSSAPLPPPHSPQKTSSGSDSRTYLSPALTTMWSSMTATRTIARQPFFAR